MFHEILCKSEGIWSPEELNLMVNLGGDKVVKVATQANIK